MRIQELFDTLVARGTTPHNLKSSVARLPKAQREAATKKFDLLKARFWKKEEKERLAVARADRAQKVARYRKAGLSVSRDADTVDKLLLTFAGCTGRSMGEKIFLFVAGHRVEVLSTTEEYARSCKYSATHSQVKISMTKREFRNLRFLGGNAIVEDSTPYALVMMGQYDQTELVRKPGRILTKVYDTPSGIVKHNYFVED